MVRLSRCQTPGSQTFHRFNRIGALAVRNSFGIWGVNHSGTNAHIPSVDGANSAHKCESTALKYVGRTGCPDLYM
jgi:hypothetical protein